MLKTLYLLYMPIICSAEFHKDFIRYIFQEFYLYEEGMIIIHANELTYKKVYR